MTPGSMLAKLHEAEDALPDLLREGVDAWQSLDIDYEPPHVERLWRPWQDGRINLHCIHPCETALSHPHPWPSAIRIITGRYEMGIGYSLDWRPDRDTKACEVARVVLGPGDQYEMIEPHGFHYVKPLDNDSLSVMVTAKPYETQLFNHDQFGKAATLGPMGPGAKAMLHAKFTAEYHYWRSNR